MASRVHHHRTSRLQSPRIKLRTASIEMLEPRRLLSAAPLELDSHAIAPASAATDQFWEELDLEFDAEHLDNIRGQVVYLDFDGAEGVDYNGPVTIEDLKIPAFDASHVGLGGQEEEIAISITETLNADFASFGVTFTRSLPSVAPYSTVFVGGDDSAFQAYGHFQGLTESVDRNNLSRSDSALVFPQSILAPKETDYVDALRDTIEHEVGHLLGILPPHDSGGSQLDNVASQVFRQDLFGVEFNGQNFTTFIESSQPFVDIDGTFELDGHEVKFGLSKDGIQKHLLSWNGTTSYSTVSGATTLMVTESVSLLSAFDDAPIYTGAFRITQPLPGSPLVVAPDGLADGNYKFGGFAFELHDIDIKFGPRSRFNATNNDFELHMTGALALPTGVSDSTFSVDVKAPNAIVLNEQGRSVSGKISVHRQNENGEDDPYTFKLANLDVEATGLALEFSEGRQPTTGIGYILYSEKKLREDERFTANPPGDDNATNLIAVRLEGTKWHYSDNYDWFEFTPVPTDRLLARINFDADINSPTRIVSLEQEAGKISEISFGFDSGNLKFLPDTFGGQSNVGDFTVTGNSFDVSGTQFLIGDIKSGIAVTDGENDKWTLRGKAKIKNLAGGIEVVADFAKDEKQGKDNFVQITVPGGDDQIPLRFDVVGEVLIDELPLQSKSGRWGINSIGVTLDTIQHRLGGKGTVTIPGGIQAEAKLGWKWGGQSVGYEIDEFAVEASKKAPGLPIPNTPLFVQSLGGAVANIASTKPLLFTGQSVTTVGPAIDFDLGFLSELASLSDAVESIAKGADAKPASLLKFDGIAEIDKNHFGSPSDKKIKATLLPNVLGNFTLAEGQLAFNVDWNKNVFRATGDLGFIDTDGSEKFAPLFHGDVRLNVDWKEDFTLSLVGKVKGNLPNIPNVYFLSGQSLGGFEIRFEYSNDGISSNDFFSIFGKVADFDIGYQLRFDGTKNIITSEAEYRTITANGGELRFDVPPGANRAIIAVNSIAENMPLPSGLSIENPQQQRIPFTDFGVGAASDFNFIPELNSALSNSFTIDSPVEGMWKIIVPDGSDLVDFELAVSADTFAPPSIEIEDAQLDDRLLYVGFALSGLAADPTVSFYLDANSIGYDGFLVDRQVISTSGLGSSQSASLDLSNVPSGDYFLYAVTDDGVHTPQVDYHGQAIRLRTPFVNSIGPTHQNEVDISPDSGVLAIYLERSGPSNADDLLRISLGGTLISQFSAIDVPEDLTRFAVPIPASKRGAKQALKLDIVPGTSGAITSEITLDRTEQLLGGLHGDVLEVDLRSREVGQPSVFRFDSFQLLGVSGVDIDNDAVITSRVFSGRGDRDLRASDGLVGTIVVSAGDESVFEQSGRFWFAPSTENLTGDSVPDINGFHGRIRVHYHVDEEPRSVVFEILPGSSVQGENAVTADRDPLGTMRLQQRLNHYGFVDFESKPLVVDGINGPRTQSALRLFKATLSSDAGAKPSDFNDSLDELTLSWLNSLNAPNWLELNDPDNSESGPFVLNGGDFDLLPGFNSATSLRDGSIQQPERFGTHWVTELIERAAASAAVDQTIIINGISAKSGIGSARYHDTHQAGMDIDVHIPDSARGTNDNNDGSPLAPPEQELLDVMFAFFERGLDQNTPVQRILLNNARVVAAFNALPRVANSPSEDARLSPPIAKLDADHDNHLHIDVLSPAEPIQTNELQLPVRSSLSPTESAAITNAISMFAQNTSALGEIGPLGTPIGLVGPTSTVASGETANLETFIAFGTGASETPFDSSNSSLADEDSTNAQFTLAKAINLESVINHHVLPEIESYFQDHSAATAAEFSTFLNEQLNVHEVKTDSGSLLSFSFDSSIVEDSTDRLAINLTLEVKQVDSRNLVLGSEATKANLIARRTEVTSDNEVASEQNAILRVTTEATIPLRMGIDRNEADSATGFFLAFRDGFKVTTFADSLEFPMGGDGSAALLLGTLGLELDGLPIGLASNPTQFLTASVDFGSVDESQLSLADLQTGSLESWLGSPVSNGEIQLSIPVKAADQLSLDVGENAAFVLSSSDVFGIDPTVDTDTIEDFGLSDFSANDLVSMFDQFGGWLEGVVASELFTQGLLLLEETSVGDKLGLVQEWEETLAGLRDEANEFRFSTVQGFFSLLNEARFFTGFNVDDSGLSFGVDWQYVLDGFDVGFDFSQSVGDLANIETAATATLSPEARLRFNIRHDLEALGTGTGVATVSEETLVQDLNQNGIKAKVAILADSVPPSPTISDDLEFELTIQQLDADDNVTVESTVAVAISQFDTQGNDGVDDLKSDLSRGLVAALKGTMFDGLVMVERQGDRLVIYSSDPSVHRLAIETATSGDLSDLGFASAQLSDQPDLRIILGDAIEGTPATEIDVNLDFVVRPGATLGDVKREIQDAADQVANGQLLVSVEEVTDVEGRLTLPRLVLREIGGSERLQVEAIGGSPAGLSGFGLGIVDQTAQSVDGSSDWRIISTDLHSDTLANHVYISPLSADEPVGSSQPILTARLFSQSDDLQVNADFALIGIEIGDGNFVAAASAELTLTEESKPLTDFFASLESMTADAVVSGPIVNQTVQPIFGVDFMSSAGLTLGDVRIDFLGIENNGAEITVTWSDLTDSDSLSMGLNQAAQDLGRFSDLGHDTIVAALNRLNIELNKTLVSHPLLGNLLPGVDVDLSQLLDFESLFGDSINAFASHPIRSLELLEPALEKSLSDALGTTADVTLSVDGDNLNLTLDFGIEQSQEFAPNFDLERLGVGSFGSLLDINGNAMANVVVGSDFSLGLGFDLSNPLVPTPFLGDSTIILSAGINATDLSFEATLGPLGIGIADGAILLDKDGNPATEDRAEVVFSITGGNSSPLDVDEEVDVNFDLDVSTMASFKAVLPVYLKTLEGTEPINPDLEVTATISKDGVSGDINDEFAMAIQRKLDSVNLINGLFASVDGWDSIFGLLDQAVDSKLFTGVPLVGDQLQDAARFISDLRSDVLNNLQQNTSRGIGTVQQKLFEALGPGGRDWLEHHEVDAETTEDELYPLGHAKRGVVRKTSRQDIRIFAITPSSPNSIQDITDAIIGGTVPVSVDAIIFDFGLSQAIANVDFDLSTELGIPGLSLDVDGRVEMRAGFSMDLGFGISKTKGVFLDVGDDENGEKDIVFNLDLQVPDLQVTGNLGFFQLEATDNGSQLVGSFGIDLKDNNAADGDNWLTLGEMSPANFGNLFDVSTDIVPLVDMHLVASIAGNSDFPSIETDLFAQWDPTYDLTRLEFQNVTLDTGEIIKNFAGTALDKISDTLAPVKPVIDVLLAPIPVISDLAGSDFTLLDLGELFGYVNPTTREFIEAASFVIDIADRSKNAPSNKFNFGTFDVGADLGLYSAANFQPLATGPSSYGGFADKFANSTSNAPSGDGAGFVIPLLAGSPTDALTNTIVPLLLGKDITLFSYDMPKFEFDFSYYQDFPIFPPFIFGTVGGAIGASADFDFGFDTYGITTTGNPFDGFFIDDFQGGDHDVPEVVLDGSITVTAGPPKIPNLGLGPAQITANAGVGGGIFIEVNFDLNDPNGDGKIRFDELERNFNRGLEAIFDIDGRVSAQLFWFLQIQAEVTFKVLGKKISKSWTVLDEGDTIVDITLLEFNQSYPDLAPLPDESPAIEANAILEPSGRLRLRSTADDDELNVSGSNGQIHVSYNGTNNTAPFEGVREIYFDGGRGDDRVTIESTITLPAILIGGPGADELSGGGGNDHLVGNTGIDILIGGAGSDTLDGGIDADQLNGGPGADELTGGDGADTLLAGPGDDRIFGGLSNDHISGGPGNDVIDGGPSNDVIHGGAGADKILGGLGSDFLFGFFGPGIPVGADQTGEDLGDEIFAGLNSNGSELGTIHLIHGGDGNDVIYGELGVDTVEGNAGDDTIRTFSGDDVIDAGPGNDHIIAGLGSDQIRAGDGNDRILAGVTEQGGGSDVDVNIIVADDSGAGNDVVFGDLGVDEVTTGSGNDRVFTFAGNDIVDAGPGDDLVVAGRGNDVITGGWGNDVLYAGVDDGGNPDGIAIDFNTMHGDLPDGDADENVPGTHNDIIYGELGIDLVQGGLGDDRIITLTGSDTIRAGAGDDEVHAGPGSDFVEGGWGADTIIAGISRAGDGAIFDTNTVYGDREDTSDLAPSSSIPGLRSDHGDLIFTDAGRDQVFAGEGDDEIRTFAGSDTIFAGWGADLVYASVDEFGGGNRFDQNVVHADPLSFAFIPLSAEAHADRVYTDHGADDITTGPGSDLVVAWGGNNTINTSGGDDQIFTIVPEDRSLEGVDTINSGDGDDSIQTGSGSDYIIAGWGADFVVAGIPGGGGDPSDRNTVFGDRADEASLTTDASHHGDTIYTDAGPDEIDTSYGPDTIVSYAGIDLINSGSGNDNVYSGEGDDWIATEAGDDIIDAGLGNDVIFAGSGNDNVTSGPTSGSGADDDFVEGDVGDDRIFGGFGKDILFGGIAAFGPLDLDRADPTQFELPVLVTDAEAVSDFRTQFAYDEFLMPVIVAGSSLEGTFDDGRDLIRAGAGQDWLFGGGDQDDLDGQGGNDYVDGGANNDLVLGGDDDDLVRGGANDDILHGDAGIDVLLGDAGADHLFGDVGTGTSLTGQRLFGGAGIDYLYAYAEQGNSNDQTNSELALLGDQLFGGPGGDFIWGNIRREILIGDAGNDTILGDYLRGPNYATNTSADTLGADDLLRGGSGEDQMYGGGGVDHMRGGADSDWLEGQDGKDMLFGDAGIDMLVFDTSSNYSSFGDDIDGHFGFGDQASGPDDNATDIVLIEGTTGDDTIRLSEIAHASNPALPKQLLVEIEGNPQSPFRGTWRRPDGAPRVEQFRVSGLSGDDDIQFISGPNAIDVSDLVARSNDFISVIDGGPGNDTLRGTDARDRLDGGSGSDVVYGKGGDDRVWGDSGFGLPSDFDILFAGQGNDDVIGGQGRNALSAWSIPPNGPLDFDDARVNSNLFAESSGQFGVFQDPAGMLRDTASLDIDLDETSELEQFTGQTFSSAPDITDIQKFVGMSVFNHTDTDLIRFTFPEGHASHADDVVTLSHLGGTGVLTLELVELDQTGEIAEALRTISTSATPEVEISISDLLRTNDENQVRQYAFRITGRPSRDNTYDPLRYEIATSFNAPDTVQRSANLVLTLSLEPEDTGLNRILGQSKSDLLFGGTGLDFLYGNEAPVTQPDQLYDRRGNLFSSFDESLAGDEWKEYAKNTGKVWYYGGSNLDDVIQVDYVTDQDSLLANRHLITRSTGNNGNFTFDAQVQLSFDAADDQGNPIWDPDRVFYDHNLTAPSPLTIAIDASGPAPSTLRSVLKFTVTIDKEAPKEATVNPTGPESTIADVIESINLGLAEAELGGRVLAVLHEDRVRLVLLDGEQMVVTPSSDESPETLGPSDIGFTGDQPFEVTAGQLSGAAQFFLSLYGDAPVFVEVPADDNNESLRDLAQDINEALNAAGLGTQVVAEIARHNLLSGGAQQSVRFRLADEQGRTSLDDPTQAAAAPIVIVALNEVALSELKFVEGQSSTRQRTTDIDIRNLLPDEGDFDAIIIDAIDGDDQVYIGPTVTKSVWVDGGPGDDLIDIQEGRPILPDQAEVDSRNEILETAFTLGGPAVAEGRPIGLIDGKPHPDFTGQLTSDATFTITLQVPAARTVGFDAAVEEPSDPKEVSTTVTVEVGRTRFDSSAPSVSTASTRLDLFDNRGLDDLIDDINDALSATTLENGSADGSQLNVGEFVTAQRFGNAIGFVTVSIGDDASLQIIPGSGADQLGLVDQIEAQNSLSLSRSQIITGLTLHDETDVDWYKIKLAPNSEINDGDSIVLTSVSAEDRVSFSLLQKEGTTGPLRILEDVNDGLNVLRIDLSSTTIPLDANQEFFIKVESDRVPTAYQLEIQTRDYLDKLDDGTIPTANVPDMVAMGRQAVDLDAYTELAKGRPEISIADIGLISGLTLHNTGGGQDVDYFKFNYTPTFDAATDRDIADIDLTAGLTITTSLDHDLATGDQVFISDTATSLDERSYFVEVHAANSFGLYIIERDTEGNEVKTAIVDATGTHSRSGVIRQSTGLDQIVLNVLESTQAVEIEIFSEQGISVGGSKTKVGQNSVAATIKTQNPGDLFIAVSSTNPSQETYVEYELQPIVGLLPGEELLEPSAHDLLLVDMASELQIDRRDVILGGTGNDRLSGGSGEEWIFGGLGDDVLNGGADRQASDLMWGGAGNDTFQLIPSDLPIVKTTERFVGSDNQETFIPTFNDRFDGGAGTDRVLFLGGDTDEQGRVVPDDVAVRYNTILHRYEFTAQVWNEDLQQFVIESGTKAPLQHYAFFQIANSTNGPTVEQFHIDTRSGDDIVHAEPEYLINGSEWGIDPQDRPQRASLTDLTMIGGPGNDRLLGGAGHDTILGGPGLDVIRGGGGNDTIDGGDGADWIAGGPSEVVPDIYEIPVGIVSGDGTNDSPSNAAFIDVDYTALLRSDDLSTLDSDEANLPIVRHLNFHLGDGEDWYVIPTPPAFTTDGQRTYDQAGAAQLVREMIELQFIRRDGGSDTDAQTEFESLPADQRIRIFPAVVSETGTQSILPVPEFAGVPDHYLIRIESPEFADAPDNPPAFGFEYELRFVRPIGEIVNLDASDAFASISPANEGDRPVVIPVGDVNGDSFSDFIGHVLDTPSGSEARLYFGGEIQRGDNHIQQAATLLLPAPLLNGDSNAPGSLIRHGDFNADGMSDIVIATTGVSDVVATDDAYRELVQSLEPVAHYSFENVSGVSVPNEIATNGIYDAVLAGGADVSSDGRFGNAIRIADNTGERLEIGAVAQAATQIPGSLNWTVSTWFKNLHPADFSRSLVKGSGPNEFDSQIIIGYTGGVFGDGDEQHLGSYEGGGGGGFVNSGYSVEDVTTGWHHLVAVGDEENAETSFYIDGKIVGISGYSSSDGIRWIGNDAGVSAGSNQPFAEFLDEVAVFDRSLSPIEIHSLFTGDPTHGDVAILLGRADAIQAWTEPVDLTHSLRGEFPQPGRPSIADVFLDDITFGPMAIDADGAQFVAGTWQESSLGGSESGVVRTFEGSSNWRSADELFGDDFDDTPNFIVADLSAEETGWHITDLPNSNGPSLYFGRPSTLNYDDGLVGGSATSKIIDVGTVAEEQPLSLSFRYRLETEGDPEHDRADVNLILQPSGTSIRLASNFDATLRETGSETGSAWAEKEIEITAGMLDGATQVEIGFVLNRMTMLPTTISAGRSMMLF